MTTAVDSGAGAAVINGALLRHEINLIIVPQTSAPFEIPGRWRKPTLVLLGDDFETAKGPGVFDASSVRRALSTAAGTVVVSSESTAKVYSAAIEIARKGNQRGQHAVLIQTQAEFEEQWLHLVRVHRRPNASLVLSIVAGYPTAPNCKPWLRPAS